MKLKKLNKKFRVIAAICYCMAAIVLSNITVLADTKSKSSGGSFSSSVLATGTINLINDISAWLLVLVPSVGSLCALVFFLRKNAANEQEQGQWDRRLKITAFCVIGGTVVSAMINVITGYYK